MSERRPGLSVVAVLTVGAVAVLVSYGALSWWYRTTGDLPEVSWLVAVAIVALSVLLVVAGRPIRAAVEGTGRTLIDPIGAYRTLRAAQAAALTGAGIVGFYGAYAAVLVPDIDARSVAGAVAVAAVIALSGLVLAGAGLWVQRMCRIDPPDDPPPEVSPR